MNLVAIGLLSLVLILGQKQIGAQETPPRTQRTPRRVNIFTNFDTLTLDQVIDYALKHAPEIKQAQFTVALVELDLKQTDFWKQLVPNITVHRGYNPAIGESSVGVGLSLDLNKMLDQPNTAKRARIKHFNAEIYLKTVKNKVVLAVTKAFYDFIAAKTYVEILEEQLQTQLKLQEIQKIQFESGHAPLNQILGNLQTIATTQLALFRAKADVKLQELQFKQTIGWDVKQ